MRHDNTYRLILFVADFCENSESALACFCSPTITVTRRELRHLRWVHLNAVLRLSGLRPAFTVLQR
jgi:hypothetical protein